jgi:hypothetical protein
MWGLGVALILYGGWLAFQTAGATGEADDSRAWPTAEGVVTASSVVKSRSQGARGSGHDIFTADVAYSYPVSGRALVGHRVHFEGVRATHEADAAAIVARYPVGAPVTVHYDPADPEHATLETGAPAWRIWRKCLGVMGVGAAIVVLAFLLAWRIRRRTYGATT